MAYRVDNGVLFQTDPAGNPVTSRPRPQSQNRGAIGTFLQGGQDVLDFILGTVGIGRMGQPMRDLGSEVFRQLSPSSNPAPGSTPSFGEVKTNMQGSAASFLLGPDSRVAQMGSATTAGSEAPGQDGDNSLSGQMGIDQRTNAQKDAQDVLDDLNKNISIMDSLDSMEGQLRPEQQHQLQELREQIALEIEANEAELKSMQAQMRAQDRIFAYDISQVEGLDIDIGPLQAAVSMEGGIGEQTLAAIQAVTGNTELTTEEQGAAMDAIINRTKFGEELVLTMNDLVRNQKDLQELEGRSDVELLGDEAQFFNPMFPEVLEADPMQRWAMSVENYLDESGILGEDVQMDQQQSGVFDAILGSLANKAPGDPIPPEVQQLITGLATSLGVDPGTLSQWIALAVDNAATEEEGIAMALEAKSLTPGSKAMVYAIMEAGRTSGIPLPEDFIMLMANSRDIHTLIDVKSQGKSGQRGDGTISGIGGLTDEMYEQMMGESWSPDKGMMWELQALMRYIYWGFEGDVQEAVRFWRRTGDWGGAAALEDGVETTKSG